MAAFLKRYESTSIELQGYASKGQCSTQFEAVKKERAAHVKRALDQQWYSTV